MAKKTEWEERIIPKKDKELRSLYMPESYTKNLKGKGKKIRWSKKEKIKPRDKYDVSHDLDTQYTYEKTSGKESRSGTPTYKGGKVQRLRASDPKERPEGKGGIALTEDILSEQTDRHQSLKTKGGGYDTIRIKNKSLGVNSPIRSGGRRFFKQDITQEIQDKKGKTTEKHDLIKNKKKYYLKTSNNKKYIPNFLIDRDDKRIDNDSLLKGLNLVGDYMNKNILKPNNINYPNARLEFINLFK